MTTISPVMKILKSRTLARRTDSPLDFMDIFNENQMLDPFHPVLRIRGEFTQEMADEFVKSLAILRKRGENGVLIDISSPGGSVYALWQMLNAMEAADMPFATYNSSHAYSAGAFLLASGAKGARFVAELSSTMLHPMSTGIGHQQIDDLIVEANHDKEINDMILDRLAKNIGMSRSRLNKELQKPSGGGAQTLWLTPKRCIELGVADIIGIPSFMTTTTLTIAGMDEVEPKPSKTTKPSKTK